MSALVNRQAPDFTATAVINGEFKDVSLSDYKEKYVVLFFYPLDFTFVCPTEIVAFNDKISEFSKRNVQLLGVSVDSHFSHLAWINTPRSDGGLGGLDYPLISDLNKSISRDYDVLFDDGGIAFRGLFLIDKDGVVQHQLVNNLSLGRNVEETLRMIDALQFVENHGEVCPANWNPGDATMKPDPEGSKEFFSQWGE